MAEALVELTDPLVAHLDPGDVVDAERVVQTIEAALAPAESADAPPTWLRADQVAPFRRLIAAITRYGAALLADPVGSGKSYVALAVAAVFQGRGTIAAIVPAPLVPQWQQLSARYGIPLSVISHDRLSRGQLPDRHTSVVILDESHRFRNPGTRRYDTLARWLPGRRLLMLSATPVVNRLDDLAHQLLLGLRSDALASHGVGDILDALQPRVVSPAFGHVVLSRPVPGDRPPVRRHHLAWEADAAMAAALEALDLLKLSTNAGVAGLIRMTLWRALASSVPALNGALRRYRALLHHAASAATSHVAISRAELRRFTAADLDQLVMWEMVSAAGETADLVLTDAARIDVLLEKLGSVTDPRITPLRQLLSDNRPTLVFTGSRDTLRALRRSSIAQAVAWIDGSGAGIGATRLAPESVLSWFKPGAGNDGPSVLLATEIAAEGLDLQRAERVVHFDLPWTPMRLEQREGRAARLGARHSVVEVVEMEPWDELEQRMRQLARLEEKRGFIRSAGLDDATEWLFRWRSRYRSEYASPPCMASVVGEEPGWLVAVDLDGAELLWIPDAGEIVTDARITTALLDSVRHQATNLELIDATGMRDRLAGWIRDRLHQREGSRWAALANDGWQRRLIRRLEVEARHAAESRRPTSLRRIEALLDLVRGGMSAGETLLLRDLTELEDRELIRRIASLGFKPRTSSTALPRLIGAVRFILPP